LIVVSSTSERVIVNCPDRRSQSSKGMRPSIHASFTVLLEHRDLEPLMLQLATRKASYAVGTVSLTGSLLVSAESEAYNPNQTLNLTSALYRKHTEDFF
jgi:hypothetical protein